MKTKEQIEEAIMNSLDWLEIPLGSYTVKIVDDGFYRDVEIIKRENV